MSEKTVFISYSHDTTEHNQRVLQLANALLVHGVDVELDQYHVRPPHGWPRWCKEQLRPEKSVFVLVICTKIYLQRVEGETPADEGRGVFWEGGIIYSYLYEKGNKRFIPVLLPRATQEDIPRPLRDDTRYQLKAFDLNDAGYLALYRELTGQPAVIKPVKGEIVTLPPNPLPPRQVMTTFVADTAAPSLQSVSGPTPWQRVCRRIEAVLKFIDSDNNGSCTITDVLTNWPELTILSRPTWRHFRYIPFPTGDALRDEECLVKAGYKPPKSFSHNFNEVVGLYCGQHDNYVKIIVYPIMYQTKLALHSENLPHATVSGGCLALDEEGYNLYIHRRSRKGTVVHEAPGRRHTFCGSH